MKGGMVQGVLSAWRAEVGFHCHVIYALFTRVGKIEAMCDRRPVNVKNERGFTFTFTRDLPCIASILPTHINLRA